MAYNRDLYTADGAALDAGIVYDQTEQMMQDEINAAIKNGDMVVGLADNLASQLNQYSTGDFIARTTGGTASLSDGDGHLVLIRGSYTHTGYVEPIARLTVTPAEREEGVDPITAAVDRDAFLAVVSGTSGEMTFSYTSSWSTNPASYGITVVGTPVSGDSIMVVYQKEVRGTIVQSNPQTFVSTGWNLYDHSTGYARTLRYSEIYGFGIEGTYSYIQFATTTSGPWSSVTVTNGRFTVPEDGYVRVVDGSESDTAIWMTWSDWNTNGHAGEFQAYSETEIDLSEIMSDYFPNGLMAVGQIQDEIDLSLRKATNKVGRLSYSAANLETVKGYGTVYEYDEDYIYYVLLEPVINDIDLSNLYFASDHGIEFFTGTALPIYAQTLYGQNLRNKLERDVLTISQQTLTASEKEQVSRNLGVVSKTHYGADNAANGSAIINSDYAFNGNPSTASYRYLSFYDKNGETTGYIRNIISSADIGVYLAGRLPNPSGTAIVNALGLYVSPSGERHVGITDIKPWRDTLHIAPRSITSISTNLNNVYDDGLYYSASSTTTNTLSNCPITGAAFCMLVVNYQPTESLSAGSYRRTQVIFSAGTIYTRRRDSASWGSWYKYPGTVV